MARDQVTLLEIRNAEWRASQEVINRLAGRILELEEELRLIKETQNQTEGEDMCSD